MFYIIIFFSHVKLNNKYITIWLFKKTIRCIAALLTGEQFIDLLPAIELLTDGLIFIDLTNHVIWRHNIKVESNNVFKILKLTNVFLSFNGINEGA